MSKKSFFFLSGTIGVLFLIAGAGILSADQKYDIKAPNGLSFNDIKGYEAWQVVAPSYRTDKNEVRYILGNPVIIEAYKKGVPKTSPAFPNGSILVKVAYSEMKEPTFPPALVPDKLQRIEFMMRDSERFKDTGGWGYARFVYDSATDAYKPYGKDASFASECFQCHTLVKDRDYVFTKYPVR
ncbi:MAG: cytochrome P460 family protein [Nitrospirae bacterium]|nr:cytochrome P460 family protein [Nitrospirota bacterium]